jgi:KDO2-lipid IV(A) lauroyltransferase
MPVALLGGLLGWLAGSVLRIRRGHVEASMLQAGLAGVRGHARTMYRALGISAVEFLWLAARGERALAHVGFDAGAGEWLAEARAHGRGVVLAASHTGNWDLAACALARELELLVVTKHLRIGWLDRFWQSTRAVRGVRLVGEHGALKAARDTLRRGGAVAMMIDQAPGDSRSRRRATAVDFLGRRCWADRAPAALAAASGAPLVVAASRRDPDGGHRLCVLDVVLPPSRATRAWIEDATTRATLALERFVRVYPDQWLWLHRRWKRLDRASSGAMLAACTTPSSSPAAPSRAA